MKVKRFNARPRRNELQAFWSLLIKHRDKFVCQWCGSTHLLQSAHIFGKQASPAVRFNLANGVTLCTSCHFKADNSHRHDFTLFCMERLGTERFEELRAMAHVSRVSWCRADYDRDLAYLNDEAIALGVETQ